MLDTDDYKVEADCIRLCTDFAAAIDARDYPSVLSLFTEDGVLAPAGEIFTGRAEIERFLNARSLLLETRHHCTNIRIRAQTDGTATGSCYVICYKNASLPAGASPPRTATPILAEFHDRYIRTAAGWRIQQREVTIISNP